MLKTICKETFTLLLVGYSDRCLNVIKNDLTTLMPLIKEDSAKHLVNSLRLTMICKIWTA